MNELITVNVLEVASEMADIALHSAVNSMPDHILDEKFPNGIEVEEAGISTYTEEAQDFFNERYAYYEAWLRSIAEPTNNVGAQEQTPENEEIDLFEHPELWSKELDEIFSRWGDRMADGLDYDNIKELLSEVNEVGYTFDYGLAAAPIELKKLS